MLLLVGACLTLQYHILGANYPMDRVVLYLVPLLGLAALLLWQGALGVAADRVATAATNGIALLLFCAFGFHNASCMNLSHFLTWKYDASTKTVMQTIRKLSRDTGPSERKQRIAVNWILEPAVNYYIVKYRMRNFKFADRRGIVGPYNYCYFTDRDLPAVRRQNVIILASYPLSETHLAVPGRRKEDR